MCMCIQGRHTTVTETSQSTIESISFITHFYKLTHNYNIFLLVRRCFFRRGKETNDTTNLGSLFIL